ncbi:MAG: SDR family oxidoreductase [Pseudomonadota bacterium]
MKETSHDHPSHPFDQRHRPSDRRCAIRPHGPVCRAPRPDHRGDVGDGRGHRPRLRARGGRCGVRRPSGRIGRSDRGADQRRCGDAGRALYVQSDVREEDQVARFVGNAQEAFGDIQVAFNNAGVVFGRGSLTGNAPLAEIEAADFDDVWATNTRGLFLGMKHEIPSMLGNEPWGRGGLRGGIVNESYVSDHGGFATIAPYSTSKHGVLGPTRGAASGYGGHELRIVGVAPDGIDTPVPRAAIEARGNDPDDAQAPNLMHRTNASDEIADMVMFLASDAASSLNGTDPNVTGGMLTGPFAPPNRNG